MIVIGIERVNFNDIKYRKRTLVNLNWPQYVRLLLTLWYVLERKFLNFTHRFTRI